MTKSDSDFTSDQPELKQILDLALEKKASNIVALDVRGLSSLTDFFVICNGESDPQVKACLLYTSPSPRDATLSRMPSSA